MKPSLWFLLLAGALTVYAVWGASAVPFHPDESTTLYMSADFETLWSRPLSLAWAPGEPVDLRVHYRLLDAPLSRQIIGLARFLRGLPAPTHDWRWDQSWVENVSAGALPGADLLATARLANTLLLPFSLYFLYLCGRILGGEAVGLGALLLMGLNALALLHARRAMSEAALLLGVCFALWTFLSGRSAWLVGLGMALAFNAKQSGIALLPVALLAAAWRPPVIVRASPPAEGSLHGYAFSLPTRFRTYPRTGWLFAWAQALIVFALITALLNPVFWKQPTVALQEAIQDRQKLATEQAADAARLAPGKQADSYTQRAAFLLINLYMAPPAFAEYGNYADQTRASEQAYRAMPGHALLRGIAGGGALLALTLLGLALSTLHFRGADALRRRALVLAYCATFALGAGVVVFFALSWQRYAIPLVPLACLWPAYPLSLIHMKHRNKK